MPKATPKKMRSAKKGGAKGKGTAVSYASNVGKKLGKNTIQTKISGSDILYEVRTGNPAINDAYIAKVIPISPATVLSGSRLNQFAPLYQRFRFTKFHLKYKPLVSTSFTGNVAVGYVADPSQEIAGTGLTLMQEVAELPFRHVGLPWKSGALNIKASDMVPAPGMKFTCDPTEEADNIEVYQGRLFFVYDNLTTTNTLYGRWELDWTVEFYDPIITKANNSAFLRGTGTGDPTDAHPWGEGFQALQGDSDLAKVGLSQSNNTMVTFLNNGQYLIYAFYPNTTGGAGLSSTTNYTLSNGCVMTSSYVFPTGGGTGKFWRYSIWAVDNGTLTLSDTAGQTHPDNGPDILILRIGPYPITNSLTSKKKMAKEIQELKQMVLSLSLQSKGQQATPPFPPFPGIQGTGHAQTVTSIVGEIVDHNNPPKFISIESASSTSIGPIETIVAPDEQKREGKKKTPKFRLLPASSDEESC